MADRKREYDAAYFTLLRAIEERDDLLRYSEYLTNERLRLDAFTAATRDLAQPLPRRMLRVVDSTTKPLLEQVGQRRAAVLSELGRMDQRLANAEAFVNECEAEVASLRG